MTRRGVLVKVIQGELLSRGHEKITTSCYHRNLQFTISLFLSQARILPIFQLRLLLITWAQVRVVMAVQSSQTLLDALDVTMGLPITWSSCNFHCWTLKAVTPQEIAGQTLRGNIQE